MKIHFLTIAAVCMLSTSFAQESSSRNYSYIEILGTGYFGSVNFERQLTKNPGIQARVGLGFAAGDTKYLTMPIGFNYLFQVGKKQRSFLDLGLGYTLAPVGTLFTGGLSNSSFTTSFGFRKHTLKKNMWRINACVIGLEESLQPWIGLSFGKCL